jgi:hypothetical protein
MFLFVSVFCCRRLVYLPLLRGSSLRKIQVTNSIYFGNVNHQLLLLIKL